MLLDDLLDGYVDWRESAGAVADAYARWSFASPGDARRLQTGRPRRPMAFAGGELKPALRELRP